VSTGISSLTTLREVLLNVKATGPDGFEGLVADALAATSGLVIRLAKSGSQFGRDGSSGPSLFAVALEAKRYDDNLRLEILAGKAILAGHVLAGKVDLWVLGATTEVGDDIVWQLSELLDSHGVSLLVLDWTPRPLPPLAVLLASARNATLAWFAAHRPDVDPAVIAAALNTVAADPSFDGQETELRSAIAVAEVGMDALRQKTSEWLRARFSNRTTSQRTFGQFITIADPSGPALPRSAAAKSLGDAMFIDDKELAVIAVLGGEGVGKTWLVAQWWAALSEPLILIFVAGRRANALNPSEPLESLAKLLAQQEDRSGEKAIASWRRRLSRWRNQSAEGQLRFVVVLDGLNEHSGKPWADILRALAVEVRALGGLVVITAREAFWQRDVLPRIRGTLTVRTVPVGGYTDLELAAILARVGAAPADLPPRVREFIRNPRVCAVAVNLLRQLSLQPNELTIERLLFEYWHWRMEERGDLVGHNIQDLERLLRSHARAWLDHPNRPFNRDDWTDHSGAIRRAPSTDIVNDLTEIEEGRFLEIAPNDSSVYVFRRETLPFALALLVTHELKSQLPVTGGNANEVLDGILDAVRGFDIVMDILVAAVGLGCLDDVFPPSGRVALIVALLRLQNLGSEALARLSAYVPTCPEAFLDAVEATEESGGRADRQLLLLDQLIETRDHPKVRPALAARLPMWLGRWSRQSQTIAEGNEQNNWRTGRLDRMTAALAALSSDETILLNKLCVEEHDLAVLPLDRAAAVLMAGRPQEHLASSLVGWALARGVAADAHDATEELGWVVRLNRIDYPQTEEAVYRLVEPIVTGASEPVRRAAASALNLLGTRRSAELAEKLVGVGRSERWRRVEYFCNTNPHDPDAPPGSNLDNARSVAANSQSLQTWSHSGRTMEDANLEAAIPSLARFDPPVIVDALRQIARSTEHRAQFPLRQLAWHLPELSPLFDQPTVTAVESAYRRLLSQPGLMRDEDSKWIISRIVEALIPHFDPEQQLDLLLQMPPDVPDFLDLLRGIKSLTAKALERWLALALTENSSVNLRRILFFASVDRVVLTDRARQIIADQVNSPDASVAACASAAVCQAKDHALNALMLKQTQPRESAAAEDEYWRSRAIATAIVEQKRADLLHLVNPQFLLYVSAALGGQTLESVAEEVGRAVSVLLEPIPSASQLSNVQMMVNISKDGFVYTKWPEEDTAANGDLNFPREMNDSTFLEYSDARNQRYRELTANLRALETTLAREGASALEQPWSVGFDQIVERDQNLVQGWLDRILATTENQSLRQIHNLGVCLAAAYAASDGTKAAAVLRHLRDSVPVIRILVGKERMSLYNYALFGAAETSALNPLREDVFAGAFDDAALEAGVIAAESGGAGPWLDRYVERLLASSHPGDLARGLTVVSLRSFDDRSDRSLAGFAGPGFLGQVTAAATKNSRRARWAQRWIERASNAPDPIDFWRFGKLAEGVADWRFAREFDNSRTEALLDRFGDELCARLQKAADARTEERKKTLFGLKVPDEDLLQVLRLEPVRTPLAR
jgi:hypothetical protein